MTTRLTNIAIDHKSTLSLLLGWVFILWSCTYRPQWRRFEVVPTAQWRRFLSLLKEAPSVFHFILLVYRRAIATSMARRSGVRWKLFSGLIFALVLSTYTMYFAYTSPGKGKAIILLPVRSLLIAPHDNKKRTRLFLSLLLDTTLLRIRLCNAHWLCIKNFNDTKWYLQ